MTASSDRNASTNEDVGAWLVTTGSYCWRFVEQVTEMPGAGDGCVRVRGRREAIARAYPHDGDRNEPRHNRESDESGAKP